MKRLILVLFGVFLGIAAVTVYLVSTQLEESTLEYGRKLSKPRTIKEFSLVDHNEKPVTEDIFTGKWTVLTFGFTHCPDICPTAMATFRDELKLLDDKRDRVQFMLVSVDPERDSPEKLKSYLAYFHKDIIGITGSLEQLRTLTKSLGVYFRKESNDEDYSMAHSPQFFLVNPQGEWTALYSPPLVRGKLALDVNRVAGKDRL